MDKYAFCETAFASGMSPWHIRKLTEAGLKLGGAADTLSFCGREVAWDLDVEITDHHLSHCCQKCKAGYDDALAEARFKPSVFMESVQLIQKHEEEKRRGLYRNAEAIAMTEEEARQKLDEILATMDVPLLRKNAGDEHLRWLLRNLGFRNAKHPKYVEAITLAKQLLLKKVG